MASGEHVGGSGIGRRDFLKATIGAGLAASMAARAAEAAAAAPQMEHKNEKPEIAYRRLGRTNLAVSALTFGCIKLVSDNLSIMDTAVGRGINMVHVCASYMQGKSIATLGEWFKKPGNRDRVWLALKPRVDVPQAQPPKNVINFDDDLKTLNTDHCDLLMMPIHQAEGVANDDLCKQLEDLKKAGKARIIGLTFHENLKAVFEAGIKANRFDVFLPTYSSATRADLKDLLPEAKKKDIGLITMKSTKGLDKGADPVPVWRTFMADGIDTVLRTLTTQTEMEQAMRLATEKAALPAQVARVNCSGQCTLCGACRGCPKGIAIQDTLRTYQYYVQDRGWMDVARSQYGEVGAALRSPECGDCGRCELVCPQNLAVRQLLREAHAAMA